jgi:hypothetical protein
MLRGWLEPQPEQQRGTFSRLVPCAALPPSGARGTKWPKKATYWSSR